MGSFVNLEVSPAPEMEIRIFQLLKVYFSKIASKKKKAWPDKMTPEAFLGMRTVRI